MDTNVLPAVRGVDRIIAKVNNGATAQTDNQNIIIAPDNVRLTDPFLIMGEEWFSSPGFDWHPHRGIETVTVVLDGVLEHGDSLGNAGLLEAGDVQWMTAGRGIIHRELAFRNERVHAMQLWINLPAARKLVPTHYQDLRAGVQAHYTEPGVSVQVVSGASGPSVGPATNEWPILGLLLTLDPTTTYQQMLPASHRVFAHAVSGRLTVAGRPVRAGQTAWSDPVAADATAASVLELATPDGGEQTRVILFAGQPLGEPVVAGGPFVMNSREEIEQAFRDYHRGKFGPIPRLARIRER
jgi:redox-sensitive bicupin YhaK (pirin superfamily)